ncbi:hypothetical protein SCARD494_03141 [Seiridium cardinale]
MSAPASPFQDSDVFEKLATTGEDNPTVRLIKETFKDFLPDDHTVEVKVTDEWWWFVLDGNRYDKPILFNNFASQTRVVAAERTLSKTITICLFRDTLVLDYEALQSLLNTLRTRYAETTDSATGGMMTAPFKIALYPKSAMGTDGPATTCGWFGPLAMNLAVGESEPTGS